jgi:hypothetical protein
MAFKSSLFEFSKCLPTDFTKNQMHIIQMGDTVVVKFPQEIKNGSLYSIKLEIEKLKGCNFMTLDDETYENIFSKSKMQ